MSMNSSLSFEIWRDGSPGQTLFNRDIQEVEFGVLYDLC
jgi:hypothetical protein